MARADPGRAKRRCDRTPRTRGRADLLAEVAGIFEGASEGELDELLARQAAQLCRLGSAEETLIPRWDRGGTPPGRGRPHTAAQRTAGEPTLTSTGLVARPVLRREQAVGE